jgi:hypothetical protein
MPVFHYSALPKIPVVSSTFELAEAKAAIIAARTNFILVVNNKILLNTKSEQF